MGTQEKGWKETQTTQQRGCRHDPEMGTAGAGEAGRPGSLSEDLSFAYQAGKGRNGRELMQGRAQQPRFSMHLDLWVHRPAYATVALLIDTFCLPH